MMFVHFTFNLKVDRLMVLGQRTAIFWDPWRAQFSPISRRKPEITYDMWADFMTSLPRPDDP
jgi:hypothetical protein